MKRISMFVAMTCACGPSSAPAEVVVQQGSPASLSVDSTEVWYVDAPPQGSEHVMRVSKAGGLASPVWTGHVITSVTADDEGVCWVDENGFGQHAFCLAHGTTTPVDLGSPPGIQADYLSTHMVMSATTVYWSTLESHVWQASRATGGVTAFSQGTGGNALALDGDAVWVATSSGARRIGTDGAVLRDVAFAPRAPADMAVCGATLYAALGGTGFSDGSVVALSTSGSGAATTIAANLDLPVNVVCDGTDVYVFLQDRARIVKCSATGAGCADVVTAVEAGGLALDSSRLFWSTGAGGTIESVALAP